MDSIQKTLTTVAVTDDPAPSEKTPHESGPDEDTPAQEDQSIRNPIQDGSASTPTVSLAWREKVVIGSLMVIGFFVSLEGIGVGVPLPFIAKGVHATSVEALWFGTSYFLATSATLPLVASYSHTFGRKALMQLSLFLFTVATVICSVARNPAALLAGRTIQGIGCGGCNAMIDIIISDLVPLKDRAAYFGLVSLSWAFGSGAGPIVGAAFAQKVTWRWIFYVLLPFNVAAMVGIQLCLRLKREEMKLDEKLREIDYVGSVLFLMSSTSLLIAVSWGGIQFPWGSWHTIAPLVLGLVGLGAFFVWEARIEKPMLPVQVFTTRTAAQGYLGIATSGALMWAVVYFLPLYYEGVLGYSLIISAVGMLPLTLTIAPVAVVTGILITKTGRYRVFLWSGWVLSTFSTGLMIHFGQTTSAVQWAFMLIPGGLGQGLLLSSMQISVQAACRDEDMAIAVAMVPELRAVGQALGLAILGTIFTNTVQEQLTKLPADLANSTSLNGLGTDPVQLVELVRSLPHGALRDHLVHVVWLASRAVWIAATSFIFVCMCCSFLARSLNLDKALQTAHQVRPEKDEEAKVVPA